MKLSLTGTGVVAVVAVAGLALLWAKRGAIGDAVSSAAAAVGDAINPASSSNLAYRGVNGIGAAATGDDSFNLGAWLFETMNPATVEAENIAIGKTTPAPAPAPYMPGAWDFGDTFGFGSP